MFGLIHECIRQLVVGSFGEEMWKNILERSGIELGKENNVNFHYTDEETYTIVENASILMKMTKDQLWEMFGTFFVQFAMSIGWEKMLRSLSPNLKGFLNNLDSLHYFIDHVVYKANLRGPSFRCEDGGEDTIILHYFSTRNGLYPIVKGIIREIAKRLYSQEVTMTLTGRTQRSVHLATGERVEEHVTFRIKVGPLSFVPQGRAEWSIVQLQMMPDSKDSGSLVSANYASSTVACGRQFSADDQRSAWTMQVMTADFGQILPYYVIMDSECKLISHGEALSKHVDANLLVPGTSIVRIFEICRPQILLDFDNITNFINAVFILQSRSSPFSVNRNSRHSDEHSPNRSWEGFDRISGSKSAENMQISHLKLKGQMMLLNENKIIYICSPYVTSVAEVMQYDLRLSSIPIHDTTRDLVLVNQQRLSDIETNKKLELNNEQMEKLASDMEREQLNADSLLREMLPSSIASKMLNGINVEPKEYANATIMFTDVPAFQAILPACQPKEIVQLLNDLFAKFDKLISLHNVYKVETVGETYMTVAGVPEEDESHCEKICHVALGMIWEGRSILDPINKTPLLVRCGVNSGHVIAGVVGQKMPRYCIFGETVVTAALMEAHSLPGRIHCSKQAITAAETTGRFEYAPRGLISIKGRGIMETYFLKRSNKKSIWDIIQRTRDENVNSIDGYAELLDGIEEETRGNNVSKACTIC